MRYFRVSHSESALIARCQVEFSSSGSREGIHLGPTATSFQAGDFLNYKYQDFFFIIKTYPGLYKEGYLGEKVGNLVMILTKQSNLIHDGIPVLYQNCLHLWLSDHKQI